MKLPRAQTSLERQRTWFFVVVGALLCALFSYIYFLSASVYHVVMRKELDQEIIAANSKVSQLESEYIIAQHQVSNSIATLEGFVVSEQKIFIDRTDDTLVLSNNNRP